MANVALAAPTLTLGGLTAPLGLFGAGTSINAATSVTVAGNNGLLLVNFITASLGGSTVVINAPNSANSVSIILAASSSYWLGPFDPAVFNYPTGSNNVGSVVVAGQLYMTSAFGSVANTVQAFYLPASKPLVSFCALHDAFYGGTPGLADA